MPLEKDTGYPASLDEPSSFSAIGQGLPLIIPLVGSLANAQEIAFVVPWDLYIRKVSAMADGVTNPGDGDVTVDVSDDGTSILTAVLSITAAETEASEDDVDALIAQGSTVKITLALSGTSPALNDLVVVLS